MTDMQLLALAVLDELVLRKRAQLDNEALREELERAKAKSAVIMERVDG